MFGPKGLCQPQSTRLHVLLWDDFAVHLERSLSLYQIMVLTNAYSTYVQSM